MTNDTTVDETGPTTTVGGACEGADGELDPDCQAPTPYCLEGECVGCDDLSEPPCSGTSPVCDAGTGSCRGCAEHSECSSAACRVSNGECFPDANQFFVDASADCPAGDGTAGNPFCLIADAMMLVEAQPGSEPWAIHVAGNATPYAGTVVWSEAKPLALLGPEAGVSAQINDANSPIISTSQEVYIARLVIDADGEAGLNVFAGGEMHVHDTEVRGGGATVNFQVVDGELHVLRSLFIEGDRGGIVDTDGVLFMDESTIDNNLGGLRLHGTATLRRSRVTASFVEGGIDVDGGTITLENSFTFNNIYVFGGMSVSNGGGATILYSTMIDGILCDASAGPVTIRNSINTAVDCPTAAIDFSAVDAGLGQGTGNAMLTPAEFDTVFVGGGGDFHVLDDAAVVADLAVWVDGDPEIDFDGDARPSVDGTSDYAGADVP